MIGTKKSYTQMSLVQGPLRNLDLEIKDGIGESTVFTICNIQGDIEMSRERTKAERNQSEQF